MERLSQSLISKITRLQKRFESILDDDFSKIEAATAEQQSGPFEPSTSLELIKGLSLALPADHVDRAIVAFSRLALLFDAGVLLENNDSQWRAQAFFEKGASQLLPQEEQFHISFPQVALLSILKTDAGAVLKKLKLERLDKDRKFSCLLIKVSPDFAYILFSKMPEIWLKDHVSAVSKELHNGFAD